MIRRAFALLSLAALTTGCKDSKCHIDDLAPEDCTKADCLSWGGSDWTDSGFANPLAAGPGGEVAVRAQDGVQLLDPDGKPLWTTELTAVLALAIAMDGDVLALTADFERDEMHLSRLAPPASSSGPTPTKTWNTAPTFSSTTTTSLGSPPRSAGMQPSSASTKMASSTPS